jgi:long-chain acyl-CoA synthetase
MILNSSGQNIYPEEVEAVLANCQYVEECLVLDRDGKITALVYPELPEDMDEETKSTIPGIIRNTANKSLPAYSKIAKVEFVEVPFEKTPKRTIKRFLYS